MQITTTTIESAHKKIRAINHKKRRAILEFIEERGEVNVTDIYIRLRLEQSIVSSYLRILREAGYIQYKRRGKQKLYSIAPRAVNITDEIANLSRT